MNDGGAEREDGTVEHVVARPRGRSAPARDRRGAVQGGLAPAGGRGSSRGPRPVRPATVAVGVRPSQPQRPVCAAPAARLGPRVLPRQPLPVRPRAAVGVRARRAGAGIAAVLITMAVVVGLGLLAGAVAESRSGGVAVSPTGAVSVTVGTQETVWEVARAVAPGASGPELSVLAERIVTVNSLTSARMRPGQVLQVPLR